MEVKARIGGSIVEINVKEGDTVALRQPLGKMEAMKMEQPILATAAGTVKTIAVKVGDKVTSGAVIMVIE